MARLNLTRSRIFGIGLATAALAFAACGHSSNSTPTVTATATATSVVSTSPSSSPCVITVGIAYEPDGGNGNGFNGVQVSHFEGNDENTCAAGGPTSTPVPVAFGSSVGGLVITPAGVDGVVDAVALLKGTGGGYNLVQDVFGGAVGSLVPAGTPYDASVQPPTASPSAGATTSPAPVIPDITSVDTIGGGAAGVALVIGPSASPPAIVAVTSLENGPPIYGLSVGFNDSTYTDTTAPNFPRSIIRIASATTSVGTVAFARGPQDLVSFAVTDASASGYQFNLEAEDASLGTGAGTSLRGNGDIAFDPANGTRALVGGTTAGGTGTLTLLTGLPNSIVKTAAITLPGTINSIVIAPNGVYAFVGTSVGLVVVSGINGSVLTAVAPFSVSLAAVGANGTYYTDCNGASVQMTDIYSVKLGDYVGGSTTNQFLVELGTSPGVTCASGRNASIIAFPFNTNSGVLPSPSPTPTASPTPVAGTTAAPTPPPVFVQNNVIAPPAGADLLVVK